MKIAILIFSILFPLVNCSEFSQDVRVSTDNVIHQTSAETNSGKELSIEDVKFDYDKKVFADVKSSIISASPLKSNRDKPDYVQSRNIHFQLTYKKAKKSPAEISVYEIDEYKNAFAPDPNYIQNLDKSFLEMQNRIDDPGKIKSYGLEQLPFIPFADADQAFYAKAQIVNFQNGKGLLFLTQFNQDTSIINNERLVYIFQGLSNDNRYFIYAEFPVSAKGLPASDADSLEDYKTPENFYGDKFEENKKAYDKYRNKIAFELDHFSDEQFTPKLSKIESLISSIKIK
jgi:hypothetical protein